MTSMANGVPFIKDVMKNTEENTNETIDFLNFIRYITIIYKSDISKRLKFLFAVCLNGSYIFHPFLFLF